MGGCSPDLGEKYRLPPNGGGVSSIGLLSLVDRQRCSWDEAHCDTWGCATLCRPVLLYNCVIATKECECGMIIRDHPNAI